MRNYPRKSPHSASPSPNGHRPRPPAITIVEQHHATVMALGEALLDALEAYTDAHPDTVLTYSHIVDAMHYVRAVLKREIEGGPQA